MENNTTFIYNYSAHENKEVQAIRRKYLPPQESKIEELKRLDRDVRLAGTTESLTAGIGGCLVFGIGLCLVLNVIGNSFFLGVTAAAAGVVGMICALPLHRRISQKTKEKLVPRILQLASELTDAN